MSLDYENYVISLVEKARAAQAIAESFTQEQVDNITQAISYTFSQPDLALELGQMLVEESGMGIPTDKQSKMMNKVKGVYYQMKGKKSVGLVEVDEEMGMETYAKPIGVIGAIIPVTNGEATPVIKALMATKTRNAIILAPHPKAKNTNLKITEILRDILRKFDAPADLIQAIDPEYVSIEASQALMKNVDFILATGGTPMVRQAYSSGNPAIGVGTGNVVCLVDGTTDLDEVAALIVKSKSFDNATSCSTENNIICFESCYDDFIAAMQKAGCYVIKEDSDEKEKLLKTMWPQSPANHDLNRAIVSQSAEAIAKEAGLVVPAGTKMLMAEENGGYGNEFPFTGEKLSPVSGIRKCADFEDGVEKMMKILDYQGKGHSCGIHTSIPERVTTLGEKIPVCKVVVNSAQCLTNSGSWTSGFPVSLTLGCGTWGHNSISHNATWKDLLNYTYVSRPIPSYQPDDKDLFDEAFINQYLK